MTQTESVVHELLALDQERLQAMAGNDVDTLNRILRRGGHEREFHKRDCVRQAELRVHSLQQHRCETLW